MKDLILEHYRELSVDSERVMRAIREKRKGTSYWTHLVPSLLAAFLLLAFGYFLTDLNLEFLSTGMDLYQAIGGVAFFLCNLAVGIWVFISQNYPYLILISGSAALLELCLLSASSRAFVPSLSR